MSSVPVLLKSLISTLLILMVLLCWISLHNPCYKTKLDRPVFKKK